MENEEARKKEQQEIERLGQKQIEEAKRKLIKEKEQQEIERLRQKQIEEAKRKLIKENEVTQKIINGEKENVKTLKQVSKDDMLKDMATGAAIAFAGTLASVEKITTDEIIKIINKSKK